MNKVEIIYNENNIQFLQFSINIYYIYINLESTKLFKIFDF